PTPAADPPAAGSVPRTSAWSFRRLAQRSRPEDRRHDVLVTRAAAQVATDRLARLLRGGGGILLQVGRDGRDEAGCAVPALQAVALVERLLHRSQAAVRGAATLHCGHFGAVHTDREEQAR